jgi:hypothetical protein
MPAKGGSRWVFFFGYLSLFAGVVDIGFDVYTRTVWSIPHDMGTVIGETALILLGLTASTIGDSLRRLEQRLDRMDSARR